MTVVEPNLHQCKCLLHSTPDCPAMAMVREGQISRNTNANTDLERTVEEAGNKCFTTRTDQEQVDGGAGGAGDQQM